MKELNYVIKDELGIHARPAGNLVKLASSFSSEITITNGDKTADAKKILNVMKLGASKSSNIKVTFSGTDEAEAFDAIGKFLNENL